MGKVGGQRNFGFGKQMVWAGQQALRARYGDGHYATVAAHGARWGQFATWAKETEGIRDARDVTSEIITAFGEALAEQVREGTVSVPYAQNLLSSVNVVLEALRGDRKVRVAPADIVGVRAHVRQSAPPGLKCGTVQDCADALRAGGHERVAVVELTASTRYRHWLTIRALVQSLRPGDDWLDRLQDPWVRPSGKGGPLRLGRPSKRPLPQSGRTNKGEEVCGST